MMFDEPERRGNPIFRVVQLMQFIMALKGAQFMMGVLLALEGFFFFYHCAVLSAPSNCDEAGPGVGLGVGLQVFWQLSLQVLTWLAFGLLPFSSQCGEVTQLGRQARQSQLAERKWRMAEKRRIEREEKARAKGPSVVALSKLKGQLPSSQQQQQQARASDTASVDSDTTSVYSDSTYSSAVTSAASKAPAGPAKGGARGIGASGGGGYMQSRSHLGGGYMPLVDEEPVEDAGLGWFKRALGEEAKPVAHETFESCEPCEPPDGAEMGALLSSVLSSPRSSSSSTNLGVISSGSYGKFPRKPARECDDADQRIPWAEGLTRADAATTSFPTTTTAFPTTTTAFPTTTTAFPALPVEETMPSAAAAEGTLESSRSSSHAEGTIESGRGQGSAPSSSAAAGSSAAAAAGSSAAMGSSVSCMYQIGRAIAQVFGFTARDNFATNRLLYLLSWDMFAFGGCASVFALLLLVLAQQSASLQPDRNLTVPTVLLSPSFYGSWRVEITFFLVRLVYALSALPFMIFHLPFVRDLLSHTFATGYTKRGVCVAYDRSGLSALIEWLDQFIQLPVAQVLSTKERAKIEKALTVARQCLVDEDGGELERPPPKQVTTRHRADLISALEAIVPPTHPLFPQLFPERQICLEYAERMRHEAARKREGAVKAARSTSQTAFKSWEEHQSSKYGVAWQRDSEATACTLCDSAFHPLLRRRHHCRLCGRLVCDPCSKSRRVPRGSSNSAKPERACDRCAQEDK